MFAYTKLMQAMAAAGVVAATDPYFNLTTLLLPGNGTNGAQNNTFLDSSTNNFTITRNGNTTQGTFSPFSLAGWSGYLDGSSNISLSSSAVPSTGAFTVECWTYITNNTGTGSQGIYSQYASADGARMQMLFDDADKKFKLTIGASSYSTTLTYPSVYNTWVHVVFTRDSSNNFSFYVNGVRDSVTSVTAAITTVNPLIGNRNGGGIPFYGYISNLRITNTAVYSGTSFTVPAAPLTSVSGTTLLTLQDNRFVDNSSSPKTLTLIGTPSVQAFSPFAPTAAYSAATNGGSGYFDGSGDYLTLSSNAALAPGTGDFTIEAWLYPTAALSTYNSVYETSATNGLLFGKITSGYGIRAAGTADLISATAPAINQWVHVAATRSGTDLRLFINGVLSATVTNSTNFATGSISLGASGAGTNAFPGYISGLRFVKGTALYTSTFTVPSAPPTAVSNTQMLTNFTNGGIIDATAKNVLETVGNAQISTTQSKFGGSSIAFDGDDTVTMPARQVLALGSGNWTIECWVRLNATGTETTIGGSKNYYTAGFNGNFVFRVGTTNLWRSFDGQASQATIDGTYSWSTGVWYHVAWVRNGSTVTCYRDGTSLGSTTDTKTLNDSANGIVLGSSLNAYVDDLRITVGQARYTTTFTPPTAAFPLS